MKTNATIFWILFGFLLFMDIVYVGWSLLDPLHGKIEWAGTLSIGLAALLAAFLGFFFSRSDRATGGPLPEDRLDANIDDGDPELGFFSPWSWWPILLAAGAALLVMGLAIGVWIAFIGVAVTLVSLVGWVYEYYRGNFAR
ncbi:MAG TPA: cytochrome c oxidase subunit 4 [Lacisediminihabitans sp.]|uniref:aa3-type cytochrome oxidase subunit IV n=1 Tax=Lacisediminihabitans sp. TaxID=2787631 RepID=UPI002ED800BE